MNGISRAAFAVALCSASSALAGPTQVNLATQAQGILPAASAPAHTGDCTNAAGSLAMTCTKIGGKTVSLAGGFSTSGAFTINLNVTGNTSVTLPTGGMLVSASSDVFWSGNHVFRAGTSIINAANNTGYVELFHVSAWNNTDGSSFSKILLGQSSTNTMFIEVRDQVNSKGTLQLSPWGGTVTINNKAIKLGANLTTTGNGAPTLAFPEAAYTYTFPAATDIVATLGASQTLTNKTLSGASNSFSNIPSSALTGTLAAAQEPAHTGDVTNTAGSLATTVNSIGGKSVSLGGSFSTTGAYPLGFTLSGATSLTLPTSGTLATVGGAMGTPSSITLTNATGLPTTGLTGTLAAAQEPAHTGDCTNAAGSLAMTCTKTNGTAFGTAATQNTGTSGATIPLLNGANTWSATQTFSGVPSLPSQSANKIFASPNGSSGAPSFRSLSSGDLPPGAMTPNNVLAFGAVADGTGAVGVGTDNGPAFTSALANGDAFVPCGTYRVATPISLAGPLNYRLHGNGACSKIYFDSSTAQALISIDYSSLGVWPVATVDHLNFIAPRNTGSTILKAISADALVFADNFSDYYAVGLDLTNSYAPRITGNFVTHGGSTFVYVGGTNDATLNGARIVDNHIFGAGGTASAAALKLACGGSGQGMLVEGNQIEGSYIGIQFHNCNSVNVRSNYIEGSTVGNLYFSGSNSSIDIQSNWLGASPTTNITNVTELNFDLNSLYNYSVTFGSDVTGSTIGNKNQLLGTSALGLLPKPTASSCGTSPTVWGTRDGGMVQLGSGATGCTLTWEKPFANTNPQCVVSPYGGPANLMITSITTSALSFTISNYGGTVTWLCHH